MVLGWQWRHTVTLLSFFGFFIIYSLRVNLSVALVAMVNQTAVREMASTPNHSVIQSPCGNGNSSSDDQKSEDGKYVWSEPTQGLILSSFFYGYIIMQIPGGWLAKKFGGKWVFGLGTLWTSLLTLLTPLAAEAGVPVLITLRVFMGLGESVTFPSMHHIYSEWVPPLERSKLPSFVDTGSYFGTVIAFSVSGYLAASGFLGGWPSVFYVFGAFGMIWFVFWAAFVSSSPKDHRWISESELNYIREEIAKEKRLETPTVPWKGILSSMAVWAIVVSHCSHNWGFYMLLTELPTYMKNILGFNVKQNGLLSALPYLCQAVIQNIAGQLVDFVRRKGYVTTKVARKISDSIAHFIPGTCLLIVGFVGCNTVLSVTLLTVAVGMTGFIGGGFFVNHLDVAPQYAGLLYGLSNTFATIPGIVGPNVVGLITDNNETVAAWREVFIITACVYYFSTVFYLIFGQGTVQPWAKMSRLNENSEKMSIETEVKENYDVTD